MDDLPLTDIAISTYDGLKDLNARHREIIRLRALGMSVREVAAQLEITPQAVVNTCSSELGREKMEELQEAADFDTVNELARIRRLIPEAIGVHEQLMKPYEETLDGDLAPIDSNTRLRAAQSLLDRGGLPKTNRTEGVSANVNVVDLIKERAKKIGRQTGNVKDISPSPGEHDESAS
jgi:predicted transcriptional regulator